MHEQIMIQGRIFSTVEPEPQTYSLFQTSVVVKLLLLPLKHPNNNPANKLRPLRDFFDGRKSGISDRALCFRTSAVIVFTSSCVEVFFVVSFFVLLVSL